jgi:hypothetical protein
MIEATRSGVRIVFALRIEFTPSTPSPTAKSFVRKVEDAAKTVLILSGTFSSIPMYAAILPWCREQKRKEGFIVSETLPIADWKRF